MTPGATAATATAAMATHAMTTDCGTPGEGTVPSRPRTHGEPATAQAPTGPGPVGASRPGRSPGIAARRLRRGAVVALLVLVPAGYLAISAGQSHSAAAERKLRAERAGLVHDTPSAVLRGLYQVPVPTGAGDVAFFEADDWEKDSLYVQFTTSPAGLADFLAGLGSSPAHLRRGLVTITIPAHLAGRVGWRFPPGHRWAGLTLSPPGLRPAHRITVSLDDPKRPVVFVASTIRFVHHHASRPPAPGHGR